ncbi:MAG: hypothetical protein COA43_06220 [Robiginitomaculum sp.]|nr:MAG: hypothetical protein COA43_06220 [Robiginitomaculum sp.]
MHNINLLKPVFLSASLIALSACSLASLPKSYSSIEKQTLNDLAPSNYTPRSALEREAILTQDLFAQAAFWSHEYDLNPADLEAAINLASSLRRLNNPAKSIEVATQTRALYPRDPGLLTELGASYIAADNPTKAIEMIDKALHHRPQLARLWSIKGAALDQLGRFDQARQHYTKALQLAPNDSGILANVGLSYALEGDPNTAEIWLRRATSIPGASAGVHQNLALVLDILGKKDDENTWASNTRTQNTRAPNTSQPRQTKPVPMAIQHRALPQHGTRLTMADDPSKLSGGPQTASEMARHMMMQKKASASQAYNPMSTQAPARAHPASQPRNNPYAKQTTRSVQSPYRTTPAVTHTATHTHGTETQPQNILNKIAGNNRSKRDIAAEQYEYLQNRQQQRIPQHMPNQQYAQPYPPTQQPQNNIQYMPQQQPLQQPQYGYQRPPARTRRR